MPLFSIACRTEHNQLLFCLLRRLLLGLFEYIYLLSYVQIYVLNSLLLHLWKFLFDRLLLQKNVSPNIH